MKARVWGSAGTEHDYFATAAMSAPAKRSLQLALCGLLLGLLLSLLMLPLALGVQQALGVAQIFRLVLLAGAGMFALVRWRLAGDVSAAAVGSALLILGITVPLRQPAALLDISFSPRVAAVVTVAIGAVLAVLIIRAHSRPALRMPLSLHGTFAVAAGASLLAAVAIGMPVWTWSAHGERVMVLAMWSFLLGLTVVWHPRSSGAAAQWLGIYLALVTVFAAFNLVFGQNVNSGVGLGEALVLVASAACVVAGSGAEVHRMLRLQDRANSRVAMDFNARVATQEHRAERLEERLHNARSSLAAARAADITLRVHHHDLNEHARETLATGLTNELSRLEELIRPVDKAVLVSDFRLADVLGPVVAAERSHGADICLSVGDLVAHGRPADLGAVVQNLIVNARLYAPGTPISIAARREEGRVLLAVEDRGPGIPASLRSNLFVRGQRGHTSAGTSGSGLGLFISYGLMLDMGGTIEVDDGPQPGARFVVEMPAGIDEWTM